MASGVTDSAYHLLFFAKADDFIDAAQIFEIPAVNRLSSYQAAWWSLHFPIFFFEIGKIMFMEYRMAIVACCIRVN